MSNRRYMEFDSTFRNRNCYPCPAEFKTQITCNNTARGGQDAVDYIAKAYPSTSWFQAPYVGEDLRGFTGTGFTNAADQDVTYTGVVQDPTIKIPHVINGQTHTSLWPVNWMQGAFPTYSTSVAVGIASTQNVNLQGGWTSGVSGARFNLTDAPVSLGFDAAIPVNFLNDRVIRTQNIMAPANFSGGTPEAPQLGQIALRTGTINNYFAGATILRFIRNPLLEPEWLVGVPPGVPTLAGTNTRSPLIGSLGQSYYYQTLTFDQNPPFPVSVGDMITQGGGAGPPFGFVQCVISQEQIVVRNGRFDANVPAGVGPPPLGEYPPYSANLNALSDIFTNVQTFITPQAGVGGVQLWGTPVQVSFVDASYNWCGFVETSIILSYDSTTGTAILETPFLSGGSNAFKPGLNNDYYLISFDNDPTGYWTQVQKGVPRIFFPAGKNIQNYYSGVYLENITYDSNYAALLGVQEGRVDSYSNISKTLYLDSVSNFQRSTPGNRGVPIVSNFTVVFFQGGVTDLSDEPEIPAGTIIVFNIEFNPGQPIAHPYRVAITRPTGSNAITFEGSLSTEDNFTNSLPSLLRLNAVIGGNNNVPLKISVPPWYKDVKLGEWPPLSGVFYDSLYDYWVQRNQPGASTTVPWFPATNPVSLGGYFGSESIVVRGKYPLQAQESLIPYEPYIAEALPISMPFGLRENCVFELQLDTGGQSYTPTKPGMPAMALMSIPSSYVPPFTGMIPSPELINGTYTFLNICWVDIRTVDSHGAITDMRINTPGNGYIAGARVFIVQGRGGNISKAVGGFPDPGPSNYTWQSSPGTGATASVMVSYQSLVIVGGSKLPSIPGVGHAVYVPTYGHGIDNSALYPSTTRPEATIYNQAPRVAEYTINFSPMSLNSTDTQNLTDQYGRVLRNNSYPRTAQNCTPNEKTFPETGLRVINAVIRSRNNQILIDRSVSVGVNTSLQYYAPGTYLGGNWSITIPGQTPLTTTGNNDVMWLGIGHGFPVSSFFGRYALAKTEYVDRELAWWPLDTYPGQTVNPGGATATKMAFVDHRFNPALQPGVPIAGLMNLSFLTTSNELQILTFDRDNENIMNYTGSTVSQNQMVCYEIELISLILPNKPLSNAIGGLIAFYPYLYVELSNVSAPSSGIKGVLYSNNPNANRALFRVGIDDTPTPTISSFIKVDGNGAVQTVKFKPNDTLHFRVFLSNGDLFQTQEQDPIPPAEPDPFLQISAEFSIQRLV